MTLKAMMTSDVGDVFFNTDDFAVTGTYSAYDGSIVSASITLMIAMNSKLQPTEFGATDNVTILLKASEVPAPRLYDTVKIGSTTYQIQQRLQSDGDVHEVIAYADQRHTPTGAG